MCALFGGMPVCNSLHEHLGCAERHMHDAVMRYFIGY
jgi:hypothetical protein